MHSLKLHHHHQHAKGPREARGARGESLHTIQYCSTVTTATATKRFCTPKASAAGHRHYAAPCIVHCVYRVLYHDPASYPVA
jgi:hypothetical protein